MCEKILRADAASACLESGGTAQWVPHEALGVGTSQGNAHGENPSAFAPTPL